MYSAVLKLGHCLRRCPNVNPTLAQCLVFAGISPVYLGKHHQHNLIISGVDDDIKVQAPQTFTFKARGPSLLSNDIFV